MEPKEEPKKILNEQKIEKEFEIINKEKSLKSSNSLDSKNSKSKSISQFNKLELNNQHFQIIQQKKAKIESSDNKFVAKNITNEHKALSDKNIVNLKNREDIKGIHLQTQDLKEINKKSLSEDKSEINSNNYGSNNNTQNVYSLLNSYYKDIDLNFKDNNAQNKGKNFLHKNRINDKNKFHNIQNEFHYNYPFVPYFYPQYSYNNNNSNNYPYNQQNSSYMMGTNSFNINNQINYHLSNNINYYNYGFPRNKFKHNRKYNNENIEHKLYILNIEDIIKGTENRTTVMIRHIPNRYTCQNLLDEINLVSKDKFDFLYLPLDIGNDCNLGYAFINFINPLHIVQFYHVFKSREWLYYNSYKECDLSFAKYQGKMELTSNFEKHMNKSNDKRRVPLLFDIKQPPKIDLPKKYFEMIKKYKPEFLNDINWI